METKYVTLDRATAWSVDQGLENKRVGLADTLAVVAGIIVALGGPFFLLEIKDYDATGGILVLGIIGFSLSVLSLVMALPVDFVNMKASALNPHYYFLIGKGRDAGVIGPGGDMSGEGAVSTDGGLQVTGAEYERIKKSHLDWVRLDKRLLAFQVILFLGGLLTMFASILWFLLVYSP